MESKFDHRKIKMFCTQCGKESKSSDKFCTSCGHALTEASLSSPSKPSSPQNIPAFQTDKIKKILIGAIFIIPAGLALLFLAFFLDAIGYSANPDPFIGLFGWGVWFTCCGLYFKNKRFKSNGLTVLIFTLVGLVAKVI